MLHLKVRPETILELSICFCWREWDKCDRLSWDKNVPWKEPSEKKRDSFNCDDASPGSTFPCFRTETRAVYTDIRTKSYWYPWGDTDNRSRITAPVQNIWHKYPWISADSRGVTDNWTMISALSPTSTRISAQMLNGQVKPGFDGHFASK